MRGRRRDGSASVELALCLPLFVLVVIGTVETCSLIHLQETLKTASYEAARLHRKESGKTRSIAPLLSYRRGRSLTQASCSRQAISPAFP